MTLFAVPDLATASTIAQPALNHSLALVPSHWERGGEMACRGMNYRYEVAWYLVYEDGSKLPYTHEQARRYEARTGLELPLANSCK